MMLCSSFSNSNTRGVTVPNFTYLKLKMLGPNRVITIGSMYRHVYECDVECVEYAEALAEAEALSADLENLSGRRQMRSAMPATSSRQRRLSPSLSTPATTPPSRSGSAPISTPNRKQCSSTFSARTPRFLRGVPRTCLAYRGMSTSTRWIFELVPDP
jgi:hypothetical protein